MSSSGRWMSEQQYGRDLTMDLIKAFAIFWVVFYHNVQLNPNSFADNFFMLVPSAAVPLFFMVSGAVFFARPFDLKRHFKRILNLYVTMVCWKLLFLLVYLPNFGWLDRSRELLSYLFLFGAIDGVPTGHFWFFSGMITVLLAAPVIYYGYCGAEYADRKKLFGYTLIVLIVFNQLLTSGNLLLAIGAKLIGKGAWGITAFGEINPFSFRYSNFLVYYLLGAALTRYREKWKTGVAVLSMGTGLAGLLLVRLWQTGTWLWAGVRLENVYYWTSTMLLSSGLFMLLGKIPVSRFRSLQWAAKYIGTATLSVYCMHILLIRYLTPAVFTPLERWNGSLLNALESLLIIGCSLVLHWGWQGIKRIRKSKSVRAGEETT